MQFFVYIMRWLILAWPGEVLYSLLRKNMDSLPAMLVGQLILGLVMFWVDRWIFASLGKGKSGHGGRKTDV